MHNTSYGRFGENSYGIKLFSNEISEQLLYLHEEID